MAYYFSETKTHAEIFEELENEIVGQHRHLERIGKDQAYLDGFGEALEIVRSARLQAEEDQI